MERTIPEKAFGCTNCGVLLENPRKRCPECGKTGTILVRENLEDRSPGDDRLGGDDSEVFRCISCGYVVFRLYRECPSCGGRFVAPDEGKAPPSKASIELMRSQF